MNLILKVGVKERTLRREIKNKGQTISQVHSCLHWLWNGYLSVVVWDTQTIPFACKITSMKAKAKKSMQEGMQNRPALVYTVTRRRRESLDERQTNKQIHIQAHLRCCLLKHEIQSLYITNHYYKRGQLERLHLWLYERECMLTPFFTLLIHQMRLFPQCNIVLDVAHWHLKNKSKKKSSSQA